MDVIKADIIDYLGKYENGVLVLLNLEHNGEFSEATIYYSDKDLALTVADTVEEKLGSPIELWSGYRDLIISILKRVVPYNQIINRLDEINFSEYLSPTDSAKVTGHGEDISDSDIQTS